jgi:cobalamin biosynthesis protein CobC
MSAASASLKESGSDMTAGLTSAAFTYHGGAREVARRLAPDAPEPWIDLSTGVNPHAYPLPDLPAEVWTRLPEAQGLAGLEAAAAARYGAPVGTVVAGPGSQALVQTLARLLPGRAGALGATYGGHAEAFAAAGVQLASADSLAAMAEFDVVIVVNPNNPDGRVTRRRDLIELHRRIAARAGTLIVDEAFADFDGARESLAPELPARRAVVLRSFGKTYGLAGLRLGFALASGDLAPKLRAALGPWPVSGPAIAVGARALGDSAWLEAAAARLTEDRTRLDELLEGAKWRVLGGTRLFRLGARPDAPQAFKRLLQAGILTRPFADAPDRLRFGIPADEAAWARLEAALGG